MFPFFPSNVIISSTYIAEHWLAHIAGDIANKRRNLKKISLCTCLFSLFFFFPALSGQATTSRQLRAVQQNLQVALANQNQRKGCSIVCLSISRLMVPAKWKLHGMISGAQCASPPSLLWSIRNWLASMSARLHCTEWSWRDGV